MYIIKKVKNRIYHIDDPLWDIANIAHINTVNWPQFDWCPNTTTKILYSYYGVHVQFQTGEKPILARYREQNSSVCKDSCVEFFFRPNENDMRYMNFEFNAFGTMFFAIRTNRYDPIYPCKNKDFFKVESFIDETKWTLQFCIPFAFIDKLFNGHTKTMYGNLYKCGEETEIPHYVSYYPIESREPDFHRPEAFDKFILE